MVHAGKRVREMRVDNAATYRHDRAGVALLIRCGFGHCSTPCTWNIMIATQLGGFLVSLLRGKIHATKLQVMLDNRVASRTVYGEPPCLMW